MTKNKKKLLLLIGFILAIVVLISADKFMKARQTANKEGLEGSSVINGDNEDGQNVSSEEDDVKAPEFNSGEETDKSGDSENEAEEITKGQDASYELWLAAGVVTGISMHYADFELEGIYLASETNLGNHADSEGVYVLFKSGGESMAVKSVPLEEERTEAGTIDLSTENFGFATFDIIEAKDVNTKDCKEVRLEKLSSLINQLMLVTLYEH